jgi:hypothetical protein
MDFIPQSVSYFFLNFLILMLILLPIFILQNPNFWSRREIIKGALQKQQSKFWFQSVRISDCVPTRVDMRNENPHWYEWKINLI